MKLRKRLLTATATVAGAAVVVSAAVAPAQTGVAAAKKITPRGVGAVKLGARHTALRAAGLVRRIQPNCEPAGPQNRGAGLKSPLQGSVDYRASSPARVRSIFIRGG